MDTVADSHMDEEEEEEAVDPRIQSELDHLNVASTEINRLENELDEARSKYRSIISETSNRMEVILRDQKRCIQKAREYYKLMGEAKIAQAEALKAARQFQTATTVYKAAKETVALAECRLVEETESNTAQLTSAWQEMLNHAISKVTVAEREKSKSEQEHKKRAGKFSELELKIQVQEKKFTRSIKKSRPYFNLKAELDIKLMQQKQNVNDLLAAIKSNKRKYQDTLRTLERISEEIHESRHQKFWSKVPRMPGVGAETDSITSSLSEFGKESAGYESDIESQIDTDKDDLDLKLKLSGDFSDYGNDKTPEYEGAKDLDETVVCQPDEVFDPQPMSCETSSQTIDKDKSDMGDIPEQVCDVYHVDVNDTLESVNKDKAKLKDYCDSGAKAGVTPPVNESADSEGKDANTAVDTKGIFAGEVNVPKTSVNKDSVKANTSTEVSTSDKVVNSSEINDGKATNKAILGGNKDDSEDELTESFESCNEEQGANPDEATESNCPDHLIEPSVTENKDEPSEDTTAKQDTNPDMATVKRPSLSGAED